jgi:hypothetical protein
MWWEGLGVEPNHSTAKTAWPSIKHSILSGEKYEVNKEDWTDSRKNIFEGCQLPYTSVKHTFHTDRFMFVINKQTCTPCYKVIAVFIQHKVTGVYGRTRLVLFKRSMDDFDKILTFAT